MVLRDPSLLESSNPQAQIVSYARHIIMVIWLNVINAVDGIT